MTNQYAELLEKAWKEYGNHKHGCQRYGRYQCTCGYTEMYLALRAAAEPAQIRDPYRPQNTADVP